MKKISSLFCAFLIATIVLNNIVAQTITNYKEVKIGNQLWMTENLNIDKFRNGDPIPEVKTNDAWKIAYASGQPAWCYYKNDSANGEKFGKLYNWYAVNDPRGLAPSGWEIPTDDDWSRLVEYLGGDSVAGKKMKSVDLWDDGEGNIGNGTNESGFNAFPYGQRDYYGNFNGMNMGVNWWSSTEEDYSEGISHDAWFRGLFFYEDILSRRAYAKGYGYYVRCLKN
ncbi:MAG: fibrobacter succinogenes major paralogous domain-containing protein [Bacteroidales bacterium]